MVGCCWPQGNVDVLVRVLGGTCWLGLCAWYGVGSVWIRA